MSMVPTLGPVAPAPQVPNVTAASGGVGELPAHGDARADLLRPGLDDERVVPRLRGERAGHGRGAAGLLADLDDRAERAPREARVLLGAGARVLERRLARRDGERSRVAHGEARRVEPGDGPGRVEGGAHDLAARRDV